MGPACTSNLKGMVHPSDHGRPTYREKASNPKLPMGSFVQNFFSNAFFLTKQTRFDLMVGMSRSGSSKSVMYHHFGPQMYLKKYQKMVKT